MRKRLADLLSELLQHLIVFGLHLIKLIIGFVNVRNGGLDTLERALYALQHLIVRHIETFCERYCDYLTLSKSFL